MKAGDKNVHNPFGDMLGIEVLELSEGKCTYRLRVREELKNPNGVVHGGVLYSLADDSMGAALFSLRGNSSHATISIYFDYMGAIKEGEILCETRVVLVKRTVAFLESDIKDGQGKPLARAVGTFRLF